jgi:hypothetical protein
MGEFISTHVIGDFEEATDLFGRSDAGDLDECSDQLKGFRLRWSRKRRFDEDDIVPSPSLVNSDVLPAHQQPVSNPPLSAATERDHTTSVTNAFLME